MIAKINQFAIGARLLGVHGREHLVRDEITENNIIYGFGV